jgi:predicted dehydrogenase
MNPLSRRSFLKTTLTAAAAGLGSVGAFAQAGSNGSSPNETVRIGIVGLGGLNVVGGVGGRGRQLIATLRKLPEARIVALCDVDQAVLDDGLQQFDKRGETVAGYKDIRRMLDDRTVDAVVVALPNHWHALATVWACQAGKDVYVEKPFSYNIWEGRQMVAAARRYKRMVQVGTQNRSSTLLRHAFESLRTGELGPMRVAHALVYRPRESLGTVSGPTPIPPTVDYDLWCGPAPKQPLLRKQLHYEWHWFWDNGNGEIGNNGIHVIDVCRWALGMNQPAPRAISVGGRFAFHDCAQTPNTLVAFFDYQPVPLICEVRNVRASQGSDEQGKFHGLGGGIVLTCEGGYLAGDATAVAWFDRHGKKIKEARPESDNLEVAHMKSFLGAVRSRQQAQLTAEALEGHRSTACCHLANVSYRIGKQARPEAIQERIRAHADLGEAYERCRDHLRANAVDLDATPAVLGSWVSFDAEREKFTGEFAEEANRFLRREYREGFAVRKV